MSLRSSKVSLVADPPIETSKYTARIHWGSKRWLVRFFGPQLTVFTMFTATTTEKLRDLSSVHYFFPLCLFVWAKRSSPAESIDYVSLRLKPCGRTVECRPFDHLACQPKARLWKGFVQEGPISAFMETPRANSGRR